VGFDRDRDFLVGKNLIIGGILLLPDDFGGNRLADTFGKLVDQLWAWDVWEKAIGVLVIDPFLDSLLGGIDRKKIDYPGNRESFVFVADMEPKNSLLIWKCVEKKSVPKAQHGMTNLNLLAGLCLELSFFRRDVPG
tara:strand:- start:5466 stop:5873 length:408 start_codon:yes stop_codon:yes gene_type:complete